MNSRDRSLCVFCLFSTPVCLSEYALWLFFEALCCHLVCLDAFLCLCGVRPFHAFVSENVCQCGRLWTFDRQVNGLLVRCNWQVAAVAHS